MKIYSKNEKNVIKMYRKIDTIFGKNNVLSYSTIVDLINKFNENGLITHIKIFVFLY
jgi:transposase